MKPGGATSRRSNVGQCGSGMRSSVTALVLALVVAVAAANAQGVGSKNAMRARVAFIQEAPGGNYNPTDNEKAHEDFVRESIEDHDQLQQQVANSQGQTIVAELPTITSSPLSPAPPVAGDSGGSIVTGPGAPAVTSIPLAKADSAADLSETKPPSKSLTLQPDWAAVQATEVSDPVQVTNTVHANWIDDSPATPPEEPKSVLAGVDIRHFGQICGRKMHTWARPEGYEGEFVGSRFYNNQGPMLRNNYAQVEYTIVLNVWLDWVDGWVKIIDFKNLQSDAGLYFHDGTAKFKRDDGSIQGEAKVASMVPNVFTQVALSRSGEGVVFAYVDGVFQFSFNDSISHIAIPDGDGGYGGPFFFFQDDIKTSKVEQERDLYGRFVENPVNKGIGDPEYEKTHRTSESSAGWLMGIRLYHRMLNDNEITRTDLQKFDLIRPLPTLKDDEEANDDQANNILGISFPKESLCGTQISKFGYETRDGLYKEENLTWPGGASKATISRFDRNRGLGVRNFIAYDAYTITMNFKMDHVDGRRKIIDFNSRKNDFGLYCVDGKVMFNGTSTGPLWSHEPVIKERELTQLTLVRDEDGPVRIYVNGREQISFDDMTMRAAIPGSREPEMVKEELGFFYFFTDTLINGEAQTAPPYPAAPQGQPESLGEAKAGGEGMGSDTLPGPMATGGWEGRIRIYGLSMPEGFIRRLSLMADDDVDALLPL